MINFATIFKCVQVTPQRNFVLNKKNFLDLKEKEIWNETNINDVNIDCEDCFVFSPKDICNHRISDHNYYAICKVSY